MTYKTILVHVDTSARAAERIKLAATLAQKENAHLIGTAMTGISHFIHAAGGINLQDPSLSAQLDILRNKAEKSLDQFEALVKEIGVASYEKRAIDDDMASGICMQARYSDLVVIGQNEFDTSPSIMADFAEYVVMNSARPLLMVPATGNFSHIGKNVLVSWNASAEATRAVASALPILKQAENVHIVIFNAEKHLDAHGDDPGADIALYLARHGVKVEVVLKSTKINVGEALLSVAADLSSDLVVMGAYGHSRFHEILLGGATRMIMKSMTVPVLMVH